MVTMQGPMVFALTFNYTNSSSGRVGQTPNNDGENVQRLVRIICQVIAVCEAANVESESERRLVYEIARQLRQLESLNQSSKCQQRCNDLQTLRTQQHCFC